jgi:hypothetical protein
MKCLVAALAVCLAAQPACAAMWVRSAAPFWRPGPRTEHDSCSHAGAVVQCYGFRLGDWKRRDRGCNPGSRECDNWIELNFAGLFMSGFAYIEKSDPGDFGISHQAYIRSLSPGLYAVETADQHGARYLVLSVPDATRPIQHAFVLDLHCIDASAQNCVIAAPAELETMAREALGRPPLATFDWIDDAVTAPKAK